MSEIREALGDDSAIPVSSAPCTASVTPSARRRRWIAAPGHRPASQPSRAAHEFHRTRSGSRGAPAARARGTRADAHGRGRVRQDPPGAGSGGASARSISGRRLGGRLSPLADPSLVTQAVASVLEFERDRSGRSRRAVGTIVRNRQILLILDNCEHLIAACAQLVDALLRAADRAVHPGDEPRGAGHHRRNRVARSVALASGTFRRRPPSRRCCGTTQ